MKSIKPFSVIFVLIASLSLTAQERKQLEDVRGQIERLEADLQKKQNTERSLLERAEDVDRKTGLQKTLLKSLEDERRQQERRIQGIGRSLRETTQSYHRLKGEVSRRIVSMYKRGKMGEWEALLSMRSLNQGVVWLKYQKRIVDNDRRNLRLLNEKQRSIETQNQQLQRELREKDELIKEERGETEKLEAQKKTQATLLDAMQNDMAALREQIDEKQRVFREIEGRISREETRRRAEPRTGEGSPFPALKGTLEWPVQGDIVQKYGPQKDPVFNTVTNNIGVVIEGKAGKKFGRYRMAGYTG